MKDMYKINFNIKKGEEFWDQFSRIFGLTLYTILLVSILMFREIIFWVILLYAIIIPFYLWQYEIHKHRYKKKKEIRLDKVRNKLIEAYKNVLDKSSELVKSLDKDCFTFKNQIKIIQAIPAKSMVDLFIDYNHGIIFYGTDESLEKTGI